MNEPIHGNDGSDNFEKGNESIHPNPAMSGNSAYIYNNPDFNPEKDVPGARGCDTTIEIIANN
jgi:hypothetical protein